MYHGPNISCLKANIIFFDQVIMSMVKLGIAFDLKSIIVFLKPFLSLIWIKTKLFTQCIDNKWANYLIHQINMASRIIALL